VEVYGYSWVIDQAKAFLRKPESHLLILFQSGRIDEGRQNNKFLQSVINDADRKGRVSLIVPETAMSSAVPHFMVVDGAAYRVETGNNALNKRQAHHTFTAIANFGDVPLAKRLQRFFHELTSKLPGVAEPESFDAGQRI